MDRKDLLSSCRYYKGEKENPFDNSPARYVWNIEKDWVDGMTNDEVCDGLSAALNHYIHVGYKDFDKFDDTPITLKSMLLSLLEKWNEGMVSYDGFSDFYDKWKSHSI